MFEVERAALLDVVEVVVEGGLKLRQGEGQGGQEDLDVAAARGIKQRDNLHPLHCRAERNTLSHRHTVTPSQPHQAWSCCLHQLQTAPPTAEGQVPL